MLAIAIEQLQHSKSALDDTFVPTNLPDDEPSEVGSPFFQLRVRPLGASSGGGMQDEDQSHATPEVLQLGATAGQGRGTSFLVG